MWGRAMPNKKMEKESSCAWERTRKVKGHFSRVVAAHVSLVYLLPTPPSFSGFFLLYRLLFSIILPHNLNSIFFSIAASLSFFSFWSFRGLSFLQTWVTPINTNLLVTLLSVFHLFFQAAFDCLEMVT